MTNEELETLVENERTDLLGDKESVDQMQVVRTGRGDTVAKGLLILGRAEEAVKWFAALSNEWCLYGEEIWEAKFENSESVTTIERPFRQYQMSLLTGLLGNINLEDAARTAYDRVTESFVDNLDQRELEPRIDTVGLLSSYLLDEPAYESFGSSLKKHVDEHGDAYRKTRFPPYVQVIDGLAIDDIETVTDGITGLLDFHEEFVIGAPDTDVVDEAFALDAAAMLVLARREGMAIDIDSDYLPAALFDEEYYPVGT